jgi:hypothetical protein
MTLRYCLSALFFLSTQTRDLAGNVKAKALLVFFLPARV